MPKTHRRLVPSEHHVSSGKKTCLALAWFWKYRPWANKNKVEKQLPSNALPTSYMTKYDNSWMSDQHLVPRDGSLWQELQLYPAFAEFKTEAILQRNL